jgi:hypothetical protein
MIFQAISFLQQRLNDKASTVTANIGEIVAGTAPMPGQGINIVLSLVNVEEDRSLRNLNFQHIGTDLTHKNPGILLNLTLLFTAIRKGDTTYDNALKNLQEVIGFFQHQYVFDHTNSPELDAGIERLNIEMMSLTMEQLNQLWSIMGGQYLPSVVYKLRMVATSNISPEREDIIRETVNNPVLKEQ